MTIPKVNPLGFPHRGRCCVCAKRRLVGPAQRFGGGSYKRPGRWYSTSVCEECANSGLDYVDSVIAEGRNPGNKVYMVSISSLRRLTGR